VQTAHPVRLDDLIAAIKGVHDDTLDQLSNAVLAADHLDTVADALIGHFVDQARRGGASWSDIGRSMGVTKQAAQKRFVAKPPDGVTPSPVDPDDGFNAFTPEARNALMAAHNEAHAMRHDAIGPTHLVLGLLAEPDALAAAAITAHGVTLGAVRDAAIASLPPASEVVPDLIPYDAAAQTALKTTFAVAQRLGHPFIGTEHILLAVLEVEPDDGVLVGVGIDKQRAEALIVEAVAEELTAPPGDAQ
jgi:hypothetical protein